MNQKVQEFLQTKKEAERVEYEKVKQQTLLDLGLYEKVYSESKQYSDDFPYVEFGDGDLENRWYRKEVIEVSDEEYEEIKKYAKEAASTNNTKTNTNMIATALTAVAWILFIVGLIAGIAFGTVEGKYYTEFSLAIAFIYWCVAAITGMILLGLAEIIKLLNLIKNK